MTGGWRKLHNEELRDLYPSPSKIRITMSRRMRWVGHVARLREKRNVNSLLVGKPRREWIILGWILESWTGPETPRNTVAPLYQLYWVPFPSLQCRYSNPPPHGLTRQAATSVFQF
jgi:hypothetical protein